LCPPPGIPPCAIGLRLGWCSFAVSPSGDDLVPLFSCMLGFGDLQVFAPVSCGSSCCGGFRVHVPPPLCLFYCGHLKVQFNPLPLPSERVGISRPPVSLPFFVSAPNSTKRRFPVTSCWEFRVDPFFFPLWGLSFFFTRLLCDVSLPGPLRGKWLMC